MKYTGIVITPKVAKDICKDKTLVEQLKMIFEDHLEVEMKVFDAKKGEYVETIRLTKKDFAGRKC